MGQFAVHENENKLTKKQYPYLLDIQNNLISDLKTRVVIPFVHKQEFFSKPIAILNPVFKIKSIEYVLLTQQLAGISSSQLGKQIADLSKQRNLIVSAIDFMVTGI